MVMGVRESGDRRSIDPTSSFDPTYERPVRRIRQHAWDTFSVAAFSLGASVTATAALWLVLTVLS